mgnify:CR=1 FL=1
MPKLRPSITDQQSRAMLATIKYGMEQAGVESDELALAARVSRATYYDRLRDPGQFRLNELRGISKKLNIPLEQLIAGKPA